LRAFAGGGDHLGGACGVAEPDVQFAPAQVDEDLVAQVERAELARQRSRLAARFDRDVLARPGARWVILLAGANDMFFGLMPGVPESELATAADIIVGHRMLIARAHLHDLRVIGCTLPPVSGAPVFTPEFEKVHTQVNQWIRDSGEFDAVTNLETALRDPARDGMPSALLAADGVHPNDAGHAAIAEVFDLALFQA
jgi:lysophospholipase L1-like esterase